MSKTEENNEIKIFKWLISIKEAQTQYLRYVTVHDLEVPPALQQSGIRLMEMSLP